MSKSKDVVLKYFDLISDNRSTEAIDLINDAGTWWISGWPAPVPNRQFKLRLPAVFEAMPMVLTVHNVHSKGKHVFLELESFATMPDGGPYNNRYAFFIETWQNSILHVREYLNSHIVAQLPADFPRPSAAE